MRTNKTARGARVDRAWSCYGKCGRTHWVWVPVVAVMLLTGCVGAPALAGSTPMPSVEYASLRADSGAQLAQVLGLKDPPDVPIVRYVDTDEIADVMDACLTEAGFLGHGDGGYDIPDGQGQVFNLAMYVCRMQYPESPNYAWPWGKQQVEIQYDWTVEFVIPCLSDHGYTVTDEVPSRATFVDTWATSPYYPFAQISVTENGAGLKRAQLERACPQVAPGPVAWGDETIDQWKSRTGR